MPRVPHPFWQGIETLEARRVLAFVIWDGGGGDTDWDNPLNWSGDSLPGATDHVLIDAPGSPTITRSHNSAATIASLWSLDALSISDGTLTIAGDWKQSAPLFMSGGRVAGGGNLIVNGEVLWIGGEIVGGGNLLIYPGRQVSIDGDVTLGRSLYNNGSLRWASGDISASGVSIQNLSGRTFTILSNGTLSSTGPTTTLLNFGTLIREGPGQTTIATRFSNYSAYIYILPPFPPPQPPGIVDVRAGTLAFTGEVVEKAGDSLFGNATWMVSSTTAKLLLPGPNLRAASGTFVLSGTNASFPQLESAQSIGSLTLAGGRAFTFSNVGAPGGSLWSLTIDSPGATVLVPGINVPGFYVLAGNVILGGGLVGGAVSVEAGASRTLRGEHRHAQPEHRQAQRCRRLQPQPDLPDHLPEHVRRGPGTDSCHRQHGPQGLPHHQLHLGRTPRLLQLPHHRAPHRGVRLHHGYRTARQHHAPLPVLRAERQVLGRHPLNLGASHDRSK